MAESDLDGIDRAVDSGTSPNAVGRGGTTLLEFAVRAGAKASFERLLERGADPNYEPPGDNRGGTILHFVAALSDPDWTKLALAAGADPNARNRVGETPLFSAMAPRDTTNLELLLAAGASVDARNDREQTPALDAAGLRQWQFVLRLLEHGADPRIPDTRFGETLASYAAKGRSLDAETEANRKKVVAFLRDRGIAVAAP